jgi:hypothetical protein
MLARSAGDWAASGRTAPTASKSGNRVQVRTAPFIFIPI